MNDEPMNMDSYIPSLWMKEGATASLAACVKRGWRTDWSARGCYLHLEVSEFIEACRGKGDSSKEEEAADVLLVFLSMCGAQRVDFDKVFSEFNRKLGGILAGTIGAGPEARLQWVCGICGPTGDAAGQAPGEQEDCINDCGGMATVRDGAGETP